MSHLRTLMSGSRDLWRRCDSWDGWWWYWVPVLMPFSFSSIIIITRSSLQDHFPYESLCLRAFALLIFWHELRRTYSTLKGSKTKSPAKSWRPDGKRQEDKGSLSSHIYSLRIWFIRTWHFSSTSCELISERGRPLRWSWLMKRSIEKGRRVQRAGYTWSQIHLDETSLKFRKKISSTNCFSNSKLRRWYKSRLRHCRKAQYFLTSSLLLSFLF